MKPVLGIKPLLRQDTRLPSLDVLDQAIAQCAIQWCSLEVYQNQQETDLRIHIIKLKEINVSVSQLQSLTMLNSRFLELVAYKKLVNSLSEKNSLLVQTVKDAVNYIDAALIQYQTALPGLELKPGDMKRLVEEIRHFKERIIMLRLLFDKQQVDHSITKRMTELRRLLVEGFRESSRQLVKLQATKLKTYEFSLRNQEVEIAREFKCLDEQFTQWRVRQSTWLGQQQANASALIEFCRRIKVSAAQTSSSHSALNAEKLTRFGGLCDQLAQNTGLSTSPACSGIFLALHTQKNLLLEQCSILLKSQSMFYDCTWFIALFVKNCERRKTLMAMQDMANRLLNLSQRTDDRVSLLFYGPALETEKLLSVDDATRAIHLYRLSPGHSDLNFQQSEGPVSRSPVDEKKNRQPLDRDISLRIWKKSTSWGNVQSEGRQKILSSRNPSFKRDG